jgi:Tfp pilus assembly protein PilN
VRAINLLPGDAAARKSFKDEDPAVVIGSALGAVVILALGAGFLNVHSKVADEQFKLDAARTQLAGLANQHTTVPKTPKPVKQMAIVPVPAVTQEEQPRLDALTSAMSQRISWDRVLREFSQVLPSDVSITTLQLSAPGGTGAPGATTTTGTGLTVSGSAFSHDGVARFLSRLELIPDLQDVTLANSNAEGDNVQFSITAGIKGAVAPAPVTPPAAATPATTDTTTTGGASS